MKLANIKKVSDKIQQSALIRMFCTLETGDLIWLSIIHQEPTSNRQIRKNVNIISKKNTINLLTTNQL